MRCLWRVSPRWKHPVNDRPIELVCFDLGGVLVRICHSWAQAAERAGVPDLMPADGQAVPESVLPALMAYEVGQLDTLSFASRLAELSAGHSTAHIHQIIDAWLIGLYDGVEQLLTDLAAAGIATACLSNTNERHWHIMSQQPAFAPLLQLTHRCASHLAQARKPDPPIYEHLESRTAATPRRIVFFDDVPANIAAATARNWHAHLIDPHGDTVSQMRQHLDSLGALRAASATG